MNFHHNLLDKNYVTLCNKHFALCIIVPYFRLGVNLFHPILEANKILLIPIKLVGVTFRWSFAKSIACALKMLYSYKKAY
mgnify:CR=1 FL=1